jgi:hypothetical protein
MHAVVQADSAHIRSKVQTPTLAGDIVRDNSGVSEQDRWVAAALKDSDIAEALRIWGGQNHDWFNLYKVFEIIESRCDIQGEERTRFTWTANHQKAAGEGARHARMKTQPPPNPMTLSEGDAFIERIFLVWIEAST